MPTVVQIYGWRLFFYANEGNEPIHVHCQKGDCRGKFWLDVNEFEIIEAKTLNMSPADKRSVRKIIFNHFDYFVSEWNDFQERKNG